MKKITILAFLFACFACDRIQKDSSTSKIEISLNLNAIEHHELRITYRITDINTDTLFLRMPQSSPGRYALHQFAKNVYSEKATDGAGNVIPWVKTDVSEWAIAGHDGTVVFEYTLYGNRAGGTYTGIDNRKVHMNMPATFMYPVGLDKRAVALRFDLTAHPEWTVATQLEKSDETNFTAPDFYYFYDSPTIAGDIDWREWTVTSTPGEQTIRIAMMHEGTGQELDDYTEWVKKVVLESEGVFGELPAFDYGEYTFLTMYNPWVYGDGMEHRNSTICSSRGNLAENASGLIGTISHEFFHCWNVERIRPKTLEPFNFDKPNMSGELWFAEGFTSYYDDLILTRAGILDTSDYVQGLAGTLNYVMNSPGRKYKNIIEMSRHAPFVDAATAIDETNFPNIFISYYTYGAAIGLALDLTIRTEYPGKSLDDLMKFMWENFGKPGRPYVIADIQNGLAVITGDEAFANEFFNSYIYKSDFPDIIPLLEQFGVEVSMQRPHQSGFLGLRLEYSEAGAQVMSPVLAANPLYEAGVARGDVIQEIEGKKIAGESDFNIDYRPGNPYQITYVQRGETKQRRFTAVGDAAMKTSFMETSGALPTAEQYSHRSSWLQSKSIR